MPMEETLDLTSFVCLKHVLLGLRASPITLNKKSSSWMIIES
jgi:hypothetical protein